MFHGSVAIHDRGGGRLFLSMKTEGAHVSRSPAFQLIPRWLGWISSELGVPWAGSWREGGGGGFSAVQEEDFRGHRSGNQTYFRSYPNFLAWAKSSSDLALSPFPRYAHPRL